MVGKLQSQKIHAVYLFRKIVVVVFLKLLLFLYLLFNFGMLFFTRFFGLKKKSVVVVAAPCGASQSSHMESALNGCQWDNFVFTCVRSLGKVFIFLQFVV